MIGASDGELAGLRAHEIGFVFQGFHLQDTMTAVENVASGMLYTGAPGARATRGGRRSRSSASASGTGSTHRPPQLSGGERQRVAIARAIAKRPVIILADEPTGNLDSQSGREVLALLHELAADGATLVLITHDERDRRRLPAADPDARRRDRRGRAAMSDRGPTARARRGRGAPSRPDRPRGCRPAS